MSVGGKDMSRKGHLLRVLGPTFGFAAVVGSVVGQGILRSPGIVAQASGSGAVLIGLWALGAALALISALPFAELGAAMPNAGGPVLWVQRAFGRAAGVATAMAMFVMYVSTSALLCFVVGEFLVRLGVGGGRFGPGALGIAVLALFCLINSAGTRASGAAQIALSSAKGFVLIGLIIVLFAQPGAAPASVSGSVAVGGALAWATAILVIINTYNGWADLVIYGEEITDPGRSIPRAMFGGIFGVAALYLLVNAALLHVLTPSAMAGSDFAAADATAGVFGTRAGLAFTAFGALSVGAIANLGVMTTSRLVFAMARSGMLPAVLTGVSRKGTPIAAMLVSSAFAATFLISGTYLALSATTVALSQAMLAVTAAAALVLRPRADEPPRPYRAPFRPWSLWIALLLNIALLGVFIVQDPFNALLGFAFVALLAVAALVLGKDTLGAAEPPSPIAGAEA